MRNIFLFFFLLWNSIEISALIVLIILINPLVSSWESFDQSAIVVAEIPNGLNAIEDKFRVCTQMSYGANYYLLLLLFLTKK